MRPVLLVVAPPLHAVAALRRGEPAWQRAGGFYGDEMRGLPCATTTTTTTTTTTAHDRRSPITRGRERRRARRRQRHAERRERRAWWERHPQV